MTTLHPTPQRPQLNERVQIVLSIEIKDLSQTVTGLMQAGIHFTIIYSPSPEEKKGSVDFGSEPLSNEPICQSKSDKKRLFMETIDQIIRDSISVGTTPTIEEVAKAAGVNGSKVKAQLSELTGKTFYQYYIEKKMEYAAQLLKTGHKATQVSEKIGYNHPIKFNKMFQKHFGITPHQYRKKNDADKG